MRPYLKNNNNNNKKKNPKNSTKRAGGVVQGVGPEFKPQYHKKQRKRIPKNHSLPFAYTLQEIFCLQKWNCKSKDFGSFVPNWL
jgi:hypothetical protein